MAGWLVLMVSLPPDPSSLRVRAWRKLRALGAVALKKSVYLLPDRPEHLEQFQWLSQEVQKARGEATLLRVDRIENLTPTEIIRRFQDARDVDYRALAARYRKVARALDRRGPASARTAEREELARLARETDRVREIDFFAAPTGEEVRRLRETLAMRLAPPAAGSPPPLEGLRGRRWVTRPRPHIDRLASAWLIKRFIDPEARFLFARPEEFPADAVPFDALGAELGHQGEDCTFETLLKRSGRTEAPLVRLAELVHEVDLRDGKYRPEEARGVDLLLRGLLAVHPDDHEVLARGLDVFDAIYAALGEE